MEESAGLTFIWTYDFQRQMSHDTLELGGKCLSPIF